MGRFSKGKVVEGLDYTVRFQSGALFKGKLNGMKPDGRGYLIIDEKGTRLVQYKEGQLVCQILENQEEEKEDKSEPKTETTTSEAEGGPKKEEKAEEEPKQKE